MEIDGKNLLETLMYMAMLQDMNEDDKLPKILAVFKKHGIGMFDAMAIMLELSAIFNEKKGEE